MSYRAAVCTALSLLAFLGGACASPAPAPADAGADDRADGGPPPADATLDEAPDASAPLLDAGLDAEAGSTPRVVDTGAIYLDDCRAFNRRCEGADATDPRCGACQYRLWYRADACTPDSPCADLLLYWAAFDCTMPQLATMLQGVLARRPRFVVACAQPIYPGEILPTTLGAPERDERVVSAMFTRLRPGGDVGVWTGENLLMAGCSMGATRYPVVAGRYPDDARWVGSRKTGVCMSDGVVDTVEQDRFVGEGTGPSCAGRHRRIAHAYTVAASTAEHRCAASPSAQCACDPAHASLRYAGDCADGDCVGFDSLVTRQDGAFVFAPGVAASSFAATHWRLVTEGEAWEADLANRCERDVVPAAPFRALCSLLDADDAHTCAYARFPDAPHCGYFNSNLDALCIDWFVGL